MFLLRGSLLSAGKALFAALRMTPCQPAAECYARLTAQSTSPPKRTPNEIQSSNMKVLYARKFSARASIRIGT